MGGDIALYMLGLLIVFILLFPDAYKFFNVTSYGSGQTSFSYHDQNDDGSIKDTITDYSEIYSLLEIFKQMLAAK